MGSPYFWFRAIIGLSAGGTTHLTTQALAQLGRRRYDMAKKAVINKAFVEKYLGENGFPPVGYFEDKKDLQKFYKHVPTEQLAEWVASEKLQFIPSDSEPINRMRMCMAVLYKHFAKAPTAQKKSKYADYTLEDLMTLAMNNDVVFETTDDDRILRMRAIMALRAAGVIN